MAKTLASVKPVKCYSDFEEPGELSLRWIGRDKRPDLRPIPCVLMTQARYRHMRAVFLAAVAEREADARAAKRTGMAECAALDRCTAELRAAIEAAEKAGAL